jgi:hypothetical protein
MGIGLFQSRIQKRFCAFCSSERRLYMKKHAGFADFAMALFMSALIMWSRWQEMNPKAIGIFVAIVMAMEVVIQLRYRLNLTCQYCGFDPVLYKKDPETAAKMVKAHMDRIRGDADFLLSEKAQNTLKRLKRVRRNHTRDSGPNP